MKIIGGWGSGNVWCVTNVLFKSNSYFCEVGIGGCILIDPGMDQSLIEDALRLKNLTPLAIFCTHGHFDHIASASFFQKKYDCNVYVSKDDNRIIKSSNFLLAALRVPQKIQLPVATFVENEMVIEVEGVKIKFLPAPGHTPGSCIIELGRIWFTGDTIYSYGIGLSSFPGEDPMVLRSTILKYWDGLSDDRLICPGHGKSGVGSSIRNLNKPLLNFLQKT